MGLASGKAPQCDHGDADTGRGHVGRFDLSCAVAPSLMSVEHLQREDDASTPTNMTDSHLWMAFDT
jgi:hypothetical protein